MTYEFPDEVEFFEKGFGYSCEFDHDEGLFSFIKTYETDEKLIFTHSPFMNNSVSVKLFYGTELVFHIYKEEITRIAFQAWGGELVLRVYLANDDNNFLVYFEPKPRLRYVEPNI